MNRFLMRTMVFGAMIFWLPMLADPYMTPRLLLVAAAAAFALFAKSDRATNLECPALAMVAAAGVVSLFAQDKFYAIIGSYQFGMDSVLAFICYSAVLIAAARSGEGVDEIARMIAIASIPVSAYGIFQRFFNDPLIWAHLHGGTRVASTQGGPIFLGAILAIVVVVCVHLAKKGDRVAWTALALALPCMWFTQTRGAMLAAAVGSAFLMPQAWIAIILSVFLIPQFVNRAASDAARLEVWKTGWRAFADHPWTGYGPGNFYLAFRRYTDWDLVGIVGNIRYVQSHAHNDILHVAATMGVIGLAAYAFLGCSLVRAALEHAERKFLLGLLAAYFVLSSFNPVTTSAFVLLAMLFGAATGRKVPVSVHGVSEPKRRALPALASMVVALSVGRLCLADYHYALAGSAGDNAAVQAMEYQEAARLNPWEMFYSCRQVDSLMRLIPLMPHEQRVPLALAGRNLAAMALEKHPMDSYAHEVMGKQIVIGHMAGYRDMDLRAALDHFNRAQELAPTFEMLMWRRLAVANGLKNAEQSRKANQDIAKLRRVTQLGSKS